ncbi:hypothetical protein HDU76_010749 [Blyttiomyces sp. JEL0837]|nr:hypothetical protein HDU76_010749 [Blyttiomyces sp. JEL0837]
MTINAIRAQLNKPKPEPGAFNGNQNVGEVFAQNFGGAEEEAGLDYLNPRRRSSRAPFLNEDPYFGEGFVNPVEEEAIFFGSNARYSDGGQDIKGKGKNTSIFEKLDNYEAEPFDRVDDDNEGRLFGDGRGRGDVEGITYREVEQRDYELVNESFAPSDAYLFNCVTKLKVDFPRESTPEIHEELQQYNWQYIPTFRSLSVKNGDLNDTRETNFRTAPERWYDDNEWEMEIHYFKARQEEDDRALAESLAAEFNQEEARPKDEECTMECGCCYSEFPLAEMTKCEDGHLFCCECARRAAENVIGLKKTDLKCLDSSGCQFSFSTSEAQRFLSEASFEYFMRLGLENDIEKVEKKEATDARLTLEEAMTNALLRQCGKCNNKFYKTEGCNKMNCPCTAITCYVCRKLVTGYDHFYQDKPVKGKCPLWEDTNKRNQDEVEKAQEEALKSIEDQKLAETLKKLHNPADIPRGVPPPHLQQQQRQHVPPIPNARINLPAVAPAIPFIGAAPNPPNRRNRNRRAPPVPAAPQLGAVPPPVLAPQLVAVPAVVAAPPVNPLVPPLPQVVGYHAHNLRRLPGRRAPVGIYVAAPMQPGQPLPPPQQQPPPQLPPPLQQPQLPQPYLQQPQLPQPYPVGQFIMLPNLMPMPMPMPQQAWVQNAAQVNPPVAPAAPAPLALAERRSKRKR